MISILNRSLKLLFWKFCASKCAICVSTKKSKYAICDELLLAPSSGKMCITNKSQQEQEQQQQQQLLNS